ncbi:hypothetical protein M0R45_008873 [Rubus argutus]|uniref:Uncharacterized protein n=1 Tax=Rubus argutus TaxID=59490 RepID=A0AAW1Y4Y0_RUBAR
MGLLIKEEKQPYRIELGLEERERERERCSPAKEAALMRNDDGEDSSGLGAQRQSSDGGLESPWIDDVIAAGQWRLRDACKSHNGGWERTEHGYTAGSSCGDADGSMRSTAQVAARENQAEIDAG